eukprot:scaffold69619_cov30-Tisochrysis_lutea.AAC.1
MGRCSKSIYGAVGVGRSVVVHSFSVQRRRSAAFRGWRLSPVSSGDARRGDMGERGPKLRDVVEAEVTAARPKPKGKGALKRTPTSLFDSAAKHQIYQCEKIVGQ